MSEQAVPRRTSLDEYPEVMTIQDIAEYLDLSVSRVYALEKQRDQFKECRVISGRKYRYDRERIRLWRAGQWDVLRQPGNKAPLRLVS